MKFVRSHWFILSLIITILLVIISEMVFRAVQRKQALQQKEKTVMLPDIRSLNSSPENDLIKYGHELIVHTALYFGPHGRISTLSNGLNCQNCHLDAGTRLYSNNFYSVATTYPRFRDRSGTVETINKRIWDCFHRSLVGNAVDTNTREIKAMAAYISWTGKSISSIRNIEGVANEEIPFITRAADPAKGSVIYTTRCKSCHGTDGQGIISSDSISYRYPPLWGNHSYAVSAGMYRLSRLASYVRNNMPPGASYKHPELINEDAWDVAAYLNSHPHPNIIFASDWPVLSSKPIDYPFGPYADGFSETQHKYGPYQEMIKK